MEKDLFCEKIMIKFLEQSRKGQAIDLRITSNFSDLESGKIKIVSENQDSMDLETIFVARRRRFFSWPGLPAL